MKIGSDISFRANKMSKAQAHYINNNLVKSKNVDIVCHEVSDKDSANSALVMYDYLKNKGINARVIISQKLDSLNIKPHEDIIQSSDVEKVESVKPDAILCVDFSKKDRIPVKTLGHILNCGNIYGLDHHNDLNIVDGNYVNITKPIEDLDAVNAVGSYYVDSSAKSATCVVYRFLEAMNKEIDSDIAYKLMLGMADDCVKKGLIVCDGNRGIIEPTEKLKEDKNAIEIFEKLLAKLDEKQKIEIAKQIDILSSLTKEEEEFKNNLESRLSFSKNGKIAYIEIPPNDKEWEKLGGDNARTSTILNRYRQEVLKNTDADVVFAFYEAGGNYRFSAHSKKDNLLEFFKYVDEKAIRGFFNNSGGHPSRGGGKIPTRNEKTCSTWVKKIIGCDDFYSN